MTFNAKDLTNMDLSPEDRAVLMQQARDQRMIDEAKLTDDQFSRLTFARAGNALGGVIGEFMDPASDTNLSPSRIKAGTKAPEGADYLTMLKMRAEQMRQAGYNSAANKLEERITLEETKRLNISAKQEETISKAKAAKLDRDLRERGMDLKFLQEAFKNNTLTPESKKKFLQSKDVADLEFRSGATDTIDDPNNPGKKIVIWKNPNDTVTELGRPATVINNSPSATSFAPSTESSRSAIESTNKIATQMAETFKATGLDKAVETVEHGQQIVALTREATNNPNAAPQLKKLLGLLNKADGNPSTAQVNEALKRSGIFYRLYDAASDRITGTLSEDQAREIINTVTTITNGAQTKLRDGLPAIQRSILSGGERTGTPVSRADWNLAFGRASRAAGIEAETDTLFGLYEKGQLGAPQSVPTKTPQIRAVSKDGTVSSMDRPTGALPVQRQPGQVSGVTKQSPNSTPGGVNRTDSGAIDISKFVRGTGR